MTGPEHYEEAELPLAALEDTPEDSVGAVAATVAQAQVHATLALAAAVGLAGQESQVDYRAWDLVCGSHDPRPARP